MPSDPKESKERIYLYALLIFIFSLLFYALPLAHRPFYTRGEGREALVVQGMFNQNNFILPLRGETTIPSKPPMFHWLGALTATAMNDLSEFAIRLPSPLCSALTLASFFFVAALFYGSNISFLGVLIAATSLEWFRNTTHARVDACFNFWLTAATLCAFFCAKAFYRKFPAPRLGYAFLGLFTAGAILSKGPAGLLLPWIIAGVYLLILYWPHLWALLRTLPYRQIIAAVLGSIFIAGIWYYLAYKIGGFDFIAVQLLKENVSRIVDIDAPDVGHRGHFYTGLLQLLLGYMPWTFFLPILIVWLWQYRKQLKDEHFQFILFCLGWILTFLVVVTLSRSKREVYLLPAYLPLSLVTAYALSNIGSSMVSWQAVQRLKKITVTFQSLFLFFFWLLVCMLGFICFSRPLIPLLAQLKIADQMQIASVIFYMQLTYWPWLLLFFATIGMGIAMSHTLLNRFSAAARALAYSFLILLLFVNTAVLPPIFAINSPKGFVQEVIQVVDEDQDIFEFKKNFYAVTYYLGRKVHYYGQPSDLPNQECFILVAEGDLDDAASELKNAAIVVSSKTNAANGKDRLYLLRINKKANPKTVRRSI
ncbi:MAG: glycosyltransferase family 39 protein [Deltaproteobacteria bacterium]|nr:glycosyltransferase family 39 protein [Deltaproteobacteria bacterium]